MKKTSIFLLAALALAGCAKSSYLGGENPELATANNGEIGFGFNMPNTYKAPARKATKSGVDAATALGNQFYVYGVKNDGETSPTYLPVFGNYSVWYTGSISSSNAKGWEYVGSAASFTAITGVPRQTTLPGGGEQYIKYWDYSAPDYWFNAISVENKTTSPANEVYTFNKATDGKIETTTIANVKEDNTIYYADAVNRPKSTYAQVLANGQTSTQPVTFTFKRLQTRVRIGIYETVPGYAINDVKFYPAGTLSADPVPFGTPSAAAVTLVTNASGATLTAGFMPASGQTYTVTYDYANDGVASLTNTTASLVYQSSKAFGQLNYTNAKDLDGTTGDEYYLGESAATATWATATVTNTAAVPAASPYMGSTDGNYWMVLPNESQSAQFKLKVDYTLTSLDGSKEAIHVTGATAYVPAEYCVWKGNTAYTYLFKISDNTNGTTGDPTSDPAGLYPITFDACVVDVEDFTQETITTVADPSITTYAEGSKVTTNDEYTTDDVVVLKAEGATATAWEYYVHTGAITENEAKFLDETASPALSWTAISDSKFTVAAAMAGKYVIVRMTYDTDKHAYKVIKIKA